MSIKAKFILAALLLGLFCGPLAAAKTFYVTDKVLLGIYKEKSQDSEVIKVLPSATPLEILERDNTFARVRTPDGIEGWVDAAYLISDKPAQLTVLELTDKHRQAVSDLRATEAKVAELEADIKKLQAGGKPEARPDNSAELKKLTSSNQALEKTNKELQTKIASLSDELDKAKKAAAAAGTAKGATDDAALKTVQAEVKTLQTQVSDEQAKTAALQKKHTELTAQYEALQQRLSTAVSALTGQAAPAAGDAAPPAAVVTVAAPAASDSSGISWKWFGIGLLVVLLGGLVLGAWLMDQRYLRRHGGFRI